MNKMLGDLLALVVLLVGFGVAFVAVAFLGCLLAAWVGPSR